MLLIADLVTLNVVILQHELQDILSNLGIPIRLPELRKYLFLLEKLQLISVFHYGNVTYYMNPSGGPEYVDYSPITPTDRSRLRSLLRQDLPLTSEKNKALTAFKRREAGGA
jgi:hypothetical protein